MSKENMPFPYQKLLAWFDMHKRDLPFRHSRDPYRIWVSEVMLQQTTVAAVVPFFNRFIDRFPTVTALAEANEADVLKLWEGLGYYRRAKHLHAAAKMLATHGNDLPNDPDIWKALPGVGRYILGAVLSQAFDRRLPIVEANTLRVYCRYFGYADEPRSSSGQKWLWQTAETVLPKLRCGDFNQALMELGSQLCKIKSPQCGKCPLKKNCVAKRDGLIDVIPVAANPKMITAIREVVLVIRRKDHFLVGQRPEGVRWAGMWEFPHGEMDDRESAMQAGLRIAKDLVNVTIASMQSRGEIKQQVTRYSMTLHILECTIRGRLKPAFHQMLAWKTLDELSDLAMPVAHRKALACSLQ